MIDSRPATDRRRATDRRLATDRRPTVDCRPTVDRRLTVDLRPTTSDYRLVRSFLPSPRLRHFAVLFGEDGCGRDVRDRGLDLVLPAGDDVPFAVHHGVESGLRHVDGTVLG